MGEKRYILSEDYGLICKTKDINGEKKYYLELVYVSLDFDSTLETKVVSTPEEANKWYKYFIGKYKGKHLTDIFIR